MRRLRSEESGFTLIELLVAASISVIIFGTTLTVLITVMRQQQANGRQNDTQQLARQTLDRMARQLRNLASPADIDVNGNASPRAIDRDLAADLIFKDVDPVKPAAGSSNTAGVRRVRYCLDSSSPGRLWLQTQTWTSATDPALPGDTACPGTGWTTTRLVATGVTNGGSRPVFTYASDTGAITATDSEARADIAHVGAKLWVDADVRQQPPETSLETSVFLRNQNREPVAIGTVTVTNPATRSVTLNGTSSTDPEGQALSLWQWYVTRPDGTTVPLSQGPVIQYSGATAGTYSFQLKVRDPANLEGVSPFYQVTL